MSTIAVQLGLLRTVRQLSQRELARRTNLRPDTISALERGQTTGIDFATLAKLCDALHCTPNDLLEVGPEAHAVPVLGGDDEDAIIAERLDQTDWTVVDNPASAAAALPTPAEEPEALTDLALAVEIAAAHLEERAALRARHVRLVEDAKVALATSADRLSTQ